jgi:hypothetical protein
LRGDFKLSIENEPQMTELLKQVARSSLYRTSVDASNKTRELCGIVDEDFEHLQERLGADQEQLLTLLDEDLSELLMAETEDHYIKGFIQGYLFLLKNQEKTQFAGTNWALKQSV